MKTLLTIKEQNNILREFMPKSELSALMSGLNGEESGHFSCKMTEIVETIATMPETYGQDGKGDEAIAYLHYFSGGSDWYITEKDSDPDGEGQIQAFGLASISGGHPDLGYISISELIEHNVELDLYFEPKTLKETKS